ncbi:MAG TPA: hypothetical protein VG145_14990 [Xanthobacteraceae bacterium]|jgi:hypothetical protein|nr:hypothetical protein [Xanthobacteraceae bacterium]
MGHSKETVLDHEAKQEKHPESPAERRQRQEKSLESGLEDTFPASDAINVVQPPPSTFDQRKTAGAT